VTRTLRLALVQQACTDSPADNLEQTLDRLRQAAADGAELVLTQELFGSRYFCQSEDPASFDLAQPIPGPHTQALGAVAAELGVVVVASFFERRGAGVYHNTAVVLERDGHLAGRYRKMHVPDDPGYHEKYYFTPGDLGFRPIDTSVGRLGVLVCWDQWYPEASRLMALAGAELLLYPTAIGWERRDASEEQARQRDAWRTVQRAHAIANVLPLAACNRTGFEPHPSAAGEGIDFWGGSFVCGPQGEILAEAPNREPAVLLADVDLSRAEELRRIWPFLRDRRIDAYEGLLERYLD
jgi:N-carbamoylputrescine amidase